MFKVIVLFGLKINHLRQADKLLINLEFIYLYYRHPHPVCANIFVNIYLYKLKSSTFLLECFFISKQWQTVGGEGGSHPLQ